MREMCPRAHMEHHRPWPRPSAAASTAKKEKGATEEVAFFLGGKTVPSPGPNGQASPSACWPCPQGMCGRQAAMTAASKGGAGRMAGLEGANEQLMHGPHMPRWKDGARSPPKWRNSVVLSASSIQHGNSSPNHLPPGVCPT